MSKPDIHLLALCYELEIERNGGDWRLRNNPTQKGLNGKPPTQTKPVPKNLEVQGETVESKLQDLNLAEKEVPEAELKPAETAAQVEAEQPAEVTSNVITEGHTLEEDASPKEDPKEPAGEAVNNETELEVTQEAEDHGEEVSDDDDSDGWITPSNLKKQQAKDSQVSKPSETIETTLEAALLTSDFAMQNVALRINLLYVYPPSQPNSL